MNDKEIRVHIVKYPGRTNLVMRYRDPITGKQVARSTESSSKKLAAKAAAVWEDELRNGKYQKPSRMSWVDFRERFTADVLDLQKVRTASLTDTTLDAFERLTGIKSLADFTAERVTTFTRELRKPYTITRGQGKKQTSREAQRSEASIAKHLRHLKAVARWAHRQGYLLKLPAFDMPKKSASTRMKGRPICGEEFDRMITATAQVVGDTDAEAWKLLLRVLWASGLRLGEALALRWDSKPGCVQVIIRGQKSVLAFGADSQKNGKVELVPLAPEAVGLLEQIESKAGRVFSVPESFHKVCTTISAIGKAAGVIVDAERGKYASAHDLRRGFGLRWSRRVMPPVLKQLMRHASISTTLEYYTGQSAESAAAELWSALGNTPGSGESSQEATKMIGRLTESGNTLGNTPAESSSAEVENTLY